MSRTRMMDGDDPTTAPEEQETPSPRTTIVGGQPEREGAGMPPVPTGIQTLLRLASVDAAFRDELVARRGEVANPAGVELTASEEAILRSIPGDQLRQMAEQMPPPPSPRRAFLRQTAATAVVLLGGAAMATAVEACCGEDEIPRPLHKDMETEGGADPHWDEETPEPATEESTPERPDHNEMQENGGAAPDVPEEIEPTPAPVSRGISPDVPPRRPQKPDHAAKGGARSDYPDED